MTLQTITKDEYREKVNFLAGVLMDSVKDEHPESDSRQHDLLHEHAVDVLDSNEWFFKRRFGPAAHGCIIENHIHDSVPVDPGLYEDDDPREAIKKLAYETMRHDVIVTASERL